jgi:hypothetical protein
VLAAEHCAVDCEGPKNGKPDSRNLASAESACWWLEAVRGHNWLWKLRKRPCTGATLLLQSVSRTGDTWYWLPEMSPPAHRCCVLTWSVGLGQPSRCSDSLRAGRSGNRIPVAARFSAPVHTGPGFYPASYTTGTRSPSRGEVAGSWL